MDEFVKRVAKCDECIHNSVCFMQEVCNDIEEHLREFGCDHYRRTADVVEVVRCEKCIYEDTTSCPLCYIEKHTLQFINHDGAFYCAKGERKDGAE